MKKEFGTKDYLASSAVVAAVCLSGHWYMDLFLAWLTIVMLFLHAAQSCCWLILRHYRRKLGDYRNMALVA